MNRRSREKLRVLRSLTLAGGGGRCCRTSSQSGRKLQNLSRFAYLRMVNVVLCLGVVQVNFVEVVNVIMQLGK